MTDASRIGAPRILVVGGAGAFGRRLVEGLAAATACTVVIAGRDLARAEATAAAVARAHPGRRIEAVRLDAARADAEALRSLELAGIVDAAGPYQATARGGDPYALARAAIAAGLPYADLADARDFVAGFPALDAAARAAGVSALTGASTTPALSNAVLDRLTAGWQRVDAIEVAITPGNRAPRGLSVMRAILSYAGRPVRVWRDGAWEARPGWGLTGRSAIPGLGRRLVSLCETPDLDILPTRFPTARTVLFRAGLELGALHLGLWLASLPVRLRLLPSLLPLARPFLRVAGLVDRLGSDRGGMVVRAQGEDGAGQPVAATWTLVAEAGDGPFVPTLPALALVRRWLDGPPLPPGAGPCVGVLDLAAIEAEMARHRIRTTVTCDGPLFARVLGPAFAEMPEPLRAVHGRGGALTLRGRATVTRGTHPLARLAARLVGFPPAGADVPVTVTIAPDRDGEIWTRRFGERAFRSRLHFAGPGRVCERFGPLAIRLAVPADRDGLTLAVEGWRLGPLPLPRALAPASEARESVDAAGRFRFDVPVRLPLAGLVVHYRGWLVPEAAPAARLEKTVP
ncbi:SDR family oxidoreductase [Methylobacterium oryzisoli]|uniref:SDR family oxidoreductase n=1 Tax=Methylobacterium oryzisoli TaxID=3385502 RepID=UPI0038924C00